VAITDILERISADAAGEAGAILKAAEAEAARITAEAEATVARETAAALAAADLGAGNEAATLLANARLEARDTLLTGKRALAEGVLDRARAALEALPDGEYLALIADAAAGACAGGETLSIASADASRLAGLPEALRTRGCDVMLGGEPAPLERGVLLAGDRVRVEISPASLVDDRREELLLVAARALFGERE
jgi:vacuolar-type H+-ATPase subunit E/Vma4